jgi:hypothetical protein
MEGVHTLPLLNCVLQRRLQADDVHSRRSTTPWAALCLTFPWLGSALDDMQQQKVSPHTWRGATCDILTSWQQVSVHATAPSLPILSAARRCVALAAGSAAGGAASDVWQLASRQNTFSRPAGSPMLPHPK